MKIFALEMNAFVVGNDDAGNNNYNYKALHSMKLMFGENFSPFSLFF